jgi:poly(3-hydroxybutyrate) depolymerase
MGIKIMKIQLQSIAVILVGLLLLPTWAEASLDDAELVFSSLDINETNRGTVNINGYDRHFSVSFPPSYDREKAYPVVLFFHGCRCRPNTSDEAILNYLDWSPRLEPFKEGFIIVRMSSFSEKKPAVRTEDSGARGMWFWHEGLAHDRDDFTFVHRVIKSLHSSSDINIDPEKLFAVGHSSGAIFLLSYVLGGPSDLADISLNDTYKFKAISVTGGSTFRKGIVDFNENTPRSLPSVLHIQGEQDKGLWFNGHETGKSGINFLSFAAPQPPIINDGLRDTIHGRTYSAWDENTPSNTSTLQKWAKNLGLKYAGYEDHRQYYIYNFAPITTSEPTSDKLLVGMRVKDCGHRFPADEVQAKFLRVFSKQNGNMKKFDTEISRDTSFKFCR